MRSELSVLMSERRLDFGRDCPRTKPHAAAHQSRPRLRRACEHGRPRPCEGLDGCDRRGKLTQHRQACPSESSFLEFQRLTLSNECVPSGQFGSLPKRQEDRGTFTVSVILAQQKQEPDLQQLSRVDWTVTEADLDLRLCANAG